MRKLHLGKTKAISIPIPIDKKISPQAFLHRRIISTPFYRTVYSSLLNKFPIKM